MLLYPRETNRNGVRCDTRKKIPSSGQEAWCFRRVGEWPQEDRLTGAIQGVWTSVRHLRPMGNERIGGTVRVAARASSDLLPYDMR